MLQPVKRDQVVLWRGLSICRGTLIQPLQLMDFRVSAAILLQFLELP